MKEFAALFMALDETNRTSEKVAAMVAYFQSGSPADPTWSADAAWTVHFLIGRRPKRLLGASRLFAWAAEISAIPEWLFSECYDAVGDLAETIALALPDSADISSSPQGLSYWVTRRLLPLGFMSEEQQRASMVQAWTELDRAERFVWNKLITGGFRVGVSQELVTRALGQALGMPSNVIAHRLMGDWTPDADFFRSLGAEETAETERSRPYPFCLAYSVGENPSDLGVAADYHAEWKWDGIRAQVIHRGGQCFVWSRGEELITDRFPEVLGVCECLPDGTVLDGEILAWADGKPMKFSDLQKRIGRKMLTKKMLIETPVVLVAFDLLECNGVDLRDKPFSERRDRLSELVANVNRLPPQDMFAGSLGFAPAGRAGKSKSPLDRPTIVDARLASESSLQGVVDRGAMIPEGDDRETTISRSRLLLAANVEFETWAELAAHREQARDLNVEGLMIKRRNAPYPVGRKKGVWWKWKVDPLTVDAVLIYAARGSGKRASLYTDYTFGIWNEGKLVSFAKAYSGLDDDEIRQVDAFVRRNTLEKFGPVRTVTPELVFELAFEGIQLSSRHKSGVAVRFPRILRWRRDKRPEEADSLDSLRLLLSDAPPMEKSGDP